VPKVESDEYAEITNLGVTSVNLKCRRLNTGNLGQDYTFSNFVLQSDQSCKVYTNEIHPNSCGGSFLSPKFRWNNNGDCVYLYDANGVLLSKKCY